MRGWETSIARRRPEGREAPGGPAPVALRLGPNPLRPGQALELRGSAPGTGGPAFVDLYDVTGRRVASAPLLADAGTTRARWTARETAVWSSGIYFARVRGDASATARFVVLR